MYQYVSLSLSFSLSLSLSLCLSVCLTISLCLPLCVSLSLSLLMCQSPPSPSYRSVGCILHILLQLKVRRPRLRLATPDLCSGVGLRARVCV